MSYCVGEKNKKKKNLKWYTLVLQIMEIKIQSLSPIETCRHLTPKDQNEISYQLTLVDFSLSVDFSVLLFHLH